MAHRWLRNPSWLGALSVLLLLVRAVPCGGEEATPTPQPKVGGTVNMQSFSFPPPNWHPHATNPAQIMSSSGIYNRHYRK